MIWSPSCHTVLDHKDSLQGISSGKEKVKSRCELPGMSYLVALDTLQGILFLIAGHAEVLVVFWDEALGSNWLLAVMTDEACLMPAIALVFHLAGTCPRARESAYGIRCLSCMQHP